MKRAEPEARTIRVEAPVGPASFVTGRLPKRAGVYRIKYRLVVGRFSPRWVLSYAYWSRHRGWRNDGRSPAEAMQRAHYTLDVERPRWRDLTPRERRILKPNEPVNARGEAASHVERPVGREGADV